MNESEDSDCSNEEVFLDFKKKKTSAKYSSLRERLFPSGFKEEFKSLLVIFFPCVFTNLFRFLNPMISMIMCGHLNKIEFDGASLANSLINILGVSIDFGFSTAFDTLFAQIYGCDQKKKMGSLLQRAVLIMTLLYLVLACFHLNVEPVLLLLRQDPQVSALASRYLTLYLPGLFFDFQFLTFSRYLQNQNIVYPMMIAAFLGDVFSGVSQYVAIYIYGYNIEASAILQGIACFVMFIIQLAYILISKVYKPTWGGFSLRDTLYDWKIVFMLGIPGILLVALEEWNYEVGTLIAGALSAVQLGAQSVAFQCAWIFYMITMGVIVSMSIRIGQYLGSGDLKRLRTCISTSVVVGSCTSLTAFTVILSMRRYIAKLFSNDPEIQLKASELLIFIAFLQFLDIAAGIPNGILKACGRQFLGACIMFICYYTLGIPLGIVLVFVVHLDVKGIWIGLMCALFIEGLIFATIIYRTNWEAECTKAINNANNLYTDKSRQDVKNDFFENSPLIVKSDAEGSRREITDSIDRRTTPTRKQNHSRTYSFSDNYMTTSGRLTLVDDNSEVEVPFKKIMITRSIIIITVLVLFVSAILVRIYVSRKPDVPVSNGSLPF